MSRAGTDIEWRSERTLPRAAREPRVHYGYQTLTRGVVAFCQTRTGAFMLSPRLESVSWRVNCKLCRHHLGMQGAPIP